MPDTASKLPRRLIIILSSVLLVALLVHFAGVALMRYYAEELLHPPLPHGTRIDSVHLNLFTGVLEIKDFELRNDELVRMRFGQLDLKVSPWRLLTGEIHVQRARLSKGFLRVDRRQDGSYDLGVPPFGTGDPVAEDPEPAPFSLAKAVLEDITVEYHDAKFSSLVHLDKMEMGAYAARVQTQDVPLSWQLSLDEREISGEASLTIDKGQVAATGKLKTGTLDLARLQRLVALEPVVKGEVAYKGDFAWQAPELSLTGALTAPAVAYTVGDRLVSIGGLDLPDFELKLFTAPQLALELVPGKDSRAAKVEWKTAEQLASAGKVRVAGRFRYEDNKLINVEGLRFDAASFGWQQGSQRMSCSDLGVAGSLQQGIAGELRLPSADLQLRAGRFEFEDTQGRLSVVLEGLAAEGLKLRPVEGAEDSRQIEGRLSVTASRVGQADTVLNLSALAVDLAGNVGLTEVRIVSDASLSELKLENPLLANGPLQIARISAEGLQLGTESQFQTLTLQGIQLPGDPPETGVNVATLSLSDGSYAEQNGIDVGEIVIDGIQAAVIRDKSGQWRHPGSAVKAQETKSKPEQAAQETSADTPALAWRVGRLRVTGDSYITTGDRTNPAAVLQRNKIDVLTFGELASMRPAQDTPFEIGLHPDKYTNFQIKGVTRPLAEPVYLDATGELQGLGMPRLNGYIANDLGHKFIDGQLDLRFDVKIADNKLKMSNFLELHRAVVEPLEGKDGPPLTTAIALLEDKDGYVKMDVPVEGRLDDPNFRVLAALNPIIMKAVAGTAALAIQPLGSVLLVGSLLADQAFKVTFNPALFEPGSTELDPTAQKYLGELAGKLKEKPKLAVRVCGVAVAAERQKDEKGAYLDNEEELLATAQQRAQAVSAYMSSRGAGKQQLRSCRPSLDAKPEARPRVDIRL